MYSRLQCHCLDLHCFFFFGMYVFCCWWSQTLRLACRPPPSRFCPPTRTFVMHFSSFSVHICDDDSPENWLVICLLVLVHKASLCFTFHSSAAFVLNFKTWWNLVCFQHWCAAMFTLNLTMINNVVTFVREPLMFQRQKREIRSEIAFNFFCGKSSQWPCNHVAVTWSWEGKCRPWIFHLVI